MSPWAQAKGPKTAEAAGALAARTPAMHFASMPSSAAALQVQLVRAMTPEHKLRLSQALRDSAWEFKAAWIRTNQPELPEAAVQQAVRRLFRHAGA
jgi:hypothetical protein